MDASAKQSEITDYINSTKNLKEQYDTIRTGKIYKQEELKELYKPITQPLKKLTDEIRQKTLPKYAQIMPKTLPEYAKQSDVTSMRQHELTSRSNPVDEQAPPQVLDKDGIIRVIGKIAQKFLSNYASKDIKTDRTFGIRVENDDLFIGNQPIWIRDNNIKFEDGTEFTGTDGLWELLTLEEPKNYNDDDVDNYVNILQKTSSYKHNNDPTSNKVKASTGYKYNNIVKPFLTKKGLLKSKTGSGLKASNLDETLKKLVGVYINIQNGHSDPQNIKDILHEIKNLDLSANLEPDKYVYWDNLDELFQRLVVLYGEIRSGNTNPTLKNEIVRILQELKEL